MSEDYKITKERILQACEQCEDAEKVLKCLFPKAFEGEWVNITTNCTLRWSGPTGSGLYFMRIDYKKKEIGIIYPNNSSIRRPGLVLYSKEYKIESSIDALSIHKKA